MKVAKVASLLALSAGILFYGNHGAKAESSYDALKQGLEKDKVQSSQMEQPSKFNSLGLLSKSKLRGGYNTQDLTGNSVYEVEPNNYLYNANILNRGDIVYGTFGQFDVDTFKFTISQTSNIGVSGLMPTYSLSDIGFIIHDQWDNLVYSDEIIQGDHIMTKGYTLSPGTYYIVALNTGYNVTNDMYGLAWDILDDTTPPPPPADVTPPPAPQVNKVDDDDTLVTGTAEPDATVEVSLNGNVIGTGIVNSDGDWGAYIPQAYPEGTVLNVTATDKAGNESLVTRVTVVSSKMAGWVIENGNRYYYVDGAPYNGWLMVEGKYYFFDIVNGGAMKRGWLFDGRQWFFLDKNTGVKRTGWVLDGKWYYLNGNGVMQTGWVKDKNTWYFLNSNGTMATGWIKDKNTWYFLNSNGTMATGWLKDKGSWYYLGTNGAMRTGWVQYGTKWYYLYGSGKMAYSTKIGKYRLGADGAWIH